MDDAKISFTVEQQAKIQMMLDRQSSRYKKNIFEATAEIERLKDENNALRNQLPALKNKNIFSSFWRG